MTQKELRKKYMQIIKTEVYPCSREMQKFSKRRCGYIVEPEWMKEKAARGQERNSEDIQRMIDGYKYLLMKCKVGGKK